MKIWIKFIVKWVLWLAVLLGLLAGGVFYAYRAMQTFFHGEEVIVPDFKGRSIMWVLEHKPDGTDIQIVEKRKNLKIKPNYVMDQNPAPGMRIKKGRLIYLVVSTGYALSELPDVTGLTARRAGLLLRNKGFFLGKKAFLFAGMGSRDQVLAQYPQPGSLSRAGDTVSLLLGADSPSSSPRVPLLKGLLLEHARELLSGYSMALGELKYGWNPSKAEGIILDQEPNPGSEWLDGFTRITVVVNRPHSSSEQEDGRKRQRVEVRLPAGLTPWDLKIELVDMQGKQLIHHQKHTPEDLFYLDVVYEKEGYLNLFLDEVFYQKIELSGEAWE
jgi:beta-lactam-binding protein with PASTA domain